MKDKVLNSCWTQTLTITSAFKNLFQHFTHKQPFTISDQFYHIQSGFDQPEITFKGKGSVCMSTQNKAKDVKVVLGLESPA